MSTELQLAFLRARADQNIDVILPPFAAAKLALVVRTALPGEAPSPFVRLSPTGNERLALTCAENVENLAAIEALEVQWVDGRSLLETMNPAYEIVVVYEGGGEYVTREQADWFRGLLKES